MKKIILLLILVLAMIAASLLVGKSQETRKSAFFDESKIVLLGNQEIDTSQEGIVQVKVAGLQAETKITAFDLSFLVEGVVAEVNKDNIKIESVFGSVIPRAVEKLAEGNFRVWVTAYTMETKEKITGADSSGVLPLFSFKFKPSGAGTVNVKADSSVIPDLAGWNPTAGSMDMDVKVNGVDELVFTVNKKEPSGADGPAFNFRIRFSGINKDTEYNTKSEVDIIMVDSTGKKYFYADVPVKTAGLGNGTYTGSLVLDAFPAGDKNYTLIKGPKHLQTKYCTDGQKTVCDTVAGSLSFGEDYEDKVYDFTKWMILAGDLPDENMVQDEVVDVADYTRLINALPLGKRTDAGLVKRNDINGNNMVDTLDLDALLETLSSKYGTLY